MTNKKLFKLTLQLSLQLSVLTLIFCKPMTALGSIAPEHNILFGTKPQHFAPAITLQKINETHSDFIPNATHGKGKISQPNGPLDLGRLSQH